MEKFFNIKSIADYKVVEFTTSALAKARELEELADALDSVAAGQANGRLLLDFTSIEFLSSQAIGIIVDLQKKTSSIPGGALVLCGVGAQLMQLLRITRLDRVLKVIKTQEELIAVS